MPVLMFSDSGNHSGSDAQTQSLSRHQMRNVTQHSYVLDASSKGLQAL